MNCKRLLCVLLALLLLALCVSCGGNPPADDHTGHDDPSAPTLRSCTVTFVFGEGFSNRTVTVTEGNTVTPPLTPPWVGHGVANWYRDEAHTEH